MTREELERIIENHKHWLEEDIEGWEYMRANLSGADLSDADLYRADLRGTNLYGVDLIGTNLTGADLTEANLTDANLTEADLTGTNLINANLYEANLRGTDLSFADLSFADLRFADLRNANLWNANLHDAILLKANLRGAKNVPYIPMVCPEEGAFIGYKKAHGKIVELYIPKDAKRSSATTRKCRCDKAKVIGIYELDGSISNIMEVCSDRDSNFIYRIHETVVVDDFDNDRWNEHSTGIHFFMQRQEAVDY